MNFGENQKKYPVEIVHHFLLRTKDAKNRKDEKKKKKVAKQPQKETRTQGNAFMKQANRKCQLRLEELPDDTCNDGSMVGRWLKENTALSKSLSKNFKNLCVDSKSYYSRLTCSV